MATGRTRDREALRAVLEYETLKRPDSGRTWPPEFWIRQWYAFKATGIGPGDIVLARMDSSGFDWKHPPRDPHPALAHDITVHSATAIAGDTLEAVIGSSRADGGACTYHLVWKGVTFKVASQYECWGGP